MQTALNESNPAHSCPIDLEKAGKKPNNSTGDRNRKMKIAKETWIILAIGLADLATTILFIQHRGAEEANPLFRRYWEMGLAVFIGAKIALLLGPLSVLEWARKRNPRFVSGALRGAIGAYLVMYTVGFYKLNDHSRSDDEIAAQIVKTSRMTRRLAELRSRTAARDAGMMSSEEAASARVTVY